MFDYAPAPRRILDRVQALEGVAARHHVPLSALALQFPLRNRAVETLLLGAASGEELASSLSHLRMAVSPEAWDEIGASNPPESPAS
jgi:D-threo-aldose 1-dehydrogenase